MALGCCPSKGDRYVVVDSFFIVGLIVCGGFMFGSCLFFIIK